MNPCSEGCTAYQFCFHHLTKDYRCEHGRVLPTRMVEANRVVQRVLDLHATITSDDFDDTDPEDDSELHFDKERESLVVRLAQPLYPRIEVPVVEGWYWRQHRLWEVIKMSGQLVYMAAGIVRSVGDARGPWFGPVPPPEDWT